MRFKYNGHLTYNEKNREVALDIINEYFDIDYDTAIKIASLEGKINTNISFDIIFRRYYNMLLCIQKNKDLYNKIFSDLKELYDINYKKVGYTNSTYDKLMLEILEYNNGNREMFPIISEVCY